jgi:hypothetical protein
MARLCSVGLAVFVLGLVNAAGLAADKLTLPLQLTVEAGQRERVDALVQFPLPKDTPDLRLRLIETTGGTQTPIAVQRDEQEGRLWWVAGGTTPVGTKRTYRLEEGDATKFPTLDIRSARGAGTVISLGGKPLLRYAHEHVAPAEGVNPKYGRSAHLHPVWTPSGAIVTDEFPLDHLHQSGIFLAFTKTEFKGHEVDFWNLGGGKGRVRHVGFKQQTSGSVFGQLRAMHEHVDLTAADAAVGLGEKTGGDVALNETWTVRAWNVGLKSGYWLLDIHSLVRCAGEQPLKLPEYHYGGMGLRAARAWKPDQVTFLTSEGDNRLKGNHTRPKWCAISGPADGKQAGLTLMTHPSNFRFPEPLRIHPTMQYMVYTPSFLGAWEITPATPYESRYRFVIHDGQLPTATIDRLWQDFAEPLTAKATQ